MNQAVDAADAATSNARTATQIVVKTLVTHAFTIANFAQICDLTRLPPKHNARLFRILIFSLVPGIALGQGIVNLTHCAIRMLRDLVEADLETLSFDREYVRFNLYCCADVFADVEHTGDGDGKRGEVVRLSDAQEITAADDRRGRAPWTWARAGRVFACLLATAQAVGSVVIWARRADYVIPGLVTYGRESALLDMDGRNMHMALGSAFASLQALPLLLFGNQWSLRPDASLSPPVGEGKRMLLETIVGALLAEILSTVESLCMSRRGGFAGVSHSGHDDDNIFALVIASLVVFAVAVAAGSVGFIPNNTLRRSRRVQNICLLILSVIFVWAMVVAMVMLVYDIRSVVDMQGAYETWSDPWEESIPVI